MTQVYEFGIEIIQNILFFAFPFVVPLLKTVTFLVIVPQSFHLWSTHVAGCLCLSENRPFFAKKLTTKQLHLKVRFQKW